MKVNKATGALASLAVIAILAGCSAAPTNTPTPTPTPTPTMTREEQQLEDAKARVVREWEVLDRLLTDPTSDISDLDPLMGGDALRELQILLNGLRDVRHVQQGRTVVLVQSAVAREGGWVVTSCIDRSSARIVDETGTPENPAPAPRTLQEDTLAMQGDDLKIVTTKVIALC